MRFIKGKLHGYIDYAAAIALIVAPFVLGFGGLAQHYYLVMGAAVILLINKDVMSASRFPTYAAGSFRSFKKITN